MKVLATVLFLVLSGFATAIRWQGSLATRDIIGSLVCALIFSYMVHLWLMPPDDEGAGR